MTELYVEINHNQCEISDGDGIFSFCYMSLKDAQIIAKQLDPLITNKIKITFYVELPDMAEVLFIDLWYDDSDSDNAIVIYSSLDAPKIKQGRNSFHGLCSEGISLDTWRRVRDWIFNGIPTKITTTL